MKNEVLLNAIYAKARIYPQKNNILKLISLVKLNIVDEYINQIYCWEDDFRKVNLPEEIRYGLELECIFPYAEDLHDTTIMMPGWYGKGDHSIYGHCSTAWDDVYDGIEITSPVLFGDNKENSNEIHKMYCLLQELEMTTNNTCGGHIHFDSDYLNTVQAFKNLVEIYANLESVFYYILNDYGDMPRDYALKYARPFSKRLYGYLSQNNDIQNAKTLDEIKNAMVNFQSSMEHEKNKKDFGLNFFNLKYGERGTIEFRTGNGNKTANEKIDAINFCGSVMVVAKKIANLQEKDDKDLTEAEKQQLNIYSIIKSDVSTEKKLNAYFYLTDFDVKTVERYKHKYLCTLIRGKNSKFEQNAKKFISTKGITLDHRYPLAICKNQSLELDR